ncbi:hypothetical protein PM082_022269 [Marasmius tenuissimus]|nr:hypothetical protein PM082_022269 [Marasmius tenuissimus]
MRGNSTPPDTPRGWLPKPLRQRLFEIDHEAIWLFHIQNPTARHADIATHFNVSRTTVTKLLKKLSMDRPVVDFNQNPRSCSRFSLEPCHDTVLLPDTKMDIDILEPALNDRDADQTNVDLNIHEEDLDLNELLDSEPETSGGQLPSVLSESRVEFSTSTKTSRAKKRLAREVPEGRPARKKRITSDNTTSQRRKDRVVCLSPFH